MKKFIDLSGEEKSYSQCMGCGLINGEFEPFGGLIYKSKNFNIAQDVELPIDGFLIISTNRCINKFSELGNEEVEELGKLIKTVLSILENNKIAEEYNIIFEEKPGVHFHVWLMPRHKWMIEKFGKVIKNIKQIQEYSIENMKTPVNLNMIYNTCSLVRNELQKLQIK